MPDQIPSSNETRSDNPPEFHIAGRVDTTQTAAENQQDAWAAAEKEIQQAATDQQRMLDMRTAMTAQEDRSISTTMTCGKCKQNQVSYAQAQTRATDEPMTTFCACNICGNRWKFS